MNEIYTQIIQKFQIKARKMTNTENLPAINSTLLPAAAEFQMFQTIANSAKKSGLYGGDEHKIFMILLSARELGVSPMLALNGGLWNIQGKVEISARLMNSLIRRAGHTMQITSTRTECTIVGMRADTKEVHTEVFTLEMAERAGIAKGNVWQKYAEDMLYARCMSRLARRLFPDVIGTSYVEGELSESKQPKEELQSMPYEEVITNDLPIPTKSVDAPPDKSLALNREQIDTIALYLPKITNKCKSNFFNFFGIKDESELYKIPIEKYKGTINSFDLNIESQKGL
jgi:hypothetical protein